MPVRYSGYLWMAVNSDCPQSTSETGATMARSQGKDPSDSFPVRGTPDGWRDVWDAPDPDTATLRLVAAIAQREAAAFVRLRAEMPRPSDADRGCWFRRPRGDGRRGEAAPATCRARPPGSAACPVGPVEPAASAPETVPKR